MNISLFFISLDGCYISNAFECIGCFLVLRSQVPAMSTPSSIELHQPNTLFDLTEIGSCERFDCREAVVEGGRSEDEESEEEDSEDLHSHVGYYNIGSFCAAL